MKLIWTLLLSTAVAIPVSLFTSDLALGAERDSEYAAGSPGAGQKYHEVCYHVMNTLRKGGRIGTDPEKRRVLYEDVNQVLSKYKFTAKAKSFLREIQGYVPTLSFVDFDNDGDEELLFRYTAGSAHCEYTYFFKKDRTGMYDYLEEEGPDQTGGRVCSGGGVSFFRHKGHNYLYVYTNPAILQKTMDVYSATRNGCHYECTVVTGPRKAATLQKDQSLEPQQ